MRPSGRAVLLFPNFFAACGGFFWNLESGILDAAIRPRQELPVPL
jgi:hypothetical protein